MAGGTKQKLSPQTLPYLDTLNLGKVMLFLMNKVNFSASDNRAGLKNTNVAMHPSLGSLVSSETPLAGDSSKQGQVGPRRTCDLVPGLSK